MLSKKLSVVLLAALLTGCNDGDDSPIVQLQPPTPIPPTNPEPPVVPPPSEPDPPVEPPTDPEPPAVIPPTSLLPAQ